jgi:hypothetical protein
MATVDMASALHGDGFGPITLLSAVTSTGDSTNTLAFPFPMSAFTVQVVIAGGTVSAVSSTLQGSVDNSNWGTLVTLTNTSGEMAHVVNKPVMFLKANLGTRTVATGTPTITFIVSGTRFA